MLQLQIQLGLLQPAQFRLQPQGSPDVPSGEVAAVGQSVSAAVAVVRLTILGPAAAAVAAVEAAAVAVAHGAATAVAVLDTTS